MRSMHTGTPSMALPCYRKGYRHGLLSLVLQQTCLTYISLLNAKHPKIEKVASHFKKTIKPKDLRQIYDRICQRGELGMSAADLRQFCFEAKLTKQGMVDVIEALLRYGL